MEGVTIYKMEDITKEFILNFFKGIKDEVKPSGRQNRNTKEKQYINNVCAFDIETTSEKDEVTGSDKIAYMYIWQFALNEEIAITGRTWEDFQRLIYYMEQVGRNIVIYVHFLSFEYQFIKSVIPFDSDKIFATNDRKILKAEYRNIEFRCSNALTNMSLKRFTHEMKVKHEKRDSGDMFKQVLYPWSELKEDYIKYAVWDVIGLVEAVKKKMTIEGDSLYTIPMTSTGYVRRDTKAAMRYERRQNIKEILPDAPVYEMLREAFRGGDTHANRYYAGRILENVVSYDRTSSYPDVLLNCQYPMEKFEYLETTDARRLLKAKETGYATLFRARLENVRLRDPLEGSPYISRDKSRLIKNGVYDNGRVLSADSLEGTYTDIDLEIIISQYKFTLYIDGFYYSKYGELPEAFKTVIRDYYKKKTELKGIPERDFEYNSAKAKLNALYGMTAQIPDKQGYEFSYENMKMEEKHDKTQQEALEYGNSRANLPYQWGVWTTAWGRYRLHEGREAVGHEYFVYSDTDSVKFIYNKEAIQNIKRYNEDRINDSKKSGAYATSITGNIYYMGVYDLDGEYKKFTTLGAKRYAYTDDDDRLHITISGVNKEAGACELENIENFRDGFIFKNSGKTESFYVDIPEERIIYREGKPIELTSYVGIYNTTYEMTLSDDYSTLLNSIRGMNE